MSDALHPLAPHHLPVFVTGPGETDVLLYGTLALLIGIVLIIGNLYFQLHSLPERMAHHKVSPVQFEIVAVLGLLALFTHNHLFWIAGLLLAMIRFPDFQTPLDRMADALETSRPVPIPGPAPQQEPEEPAATPGALELKPKLSEVR